MGTCSDCSWPVGDLVTAFEVACTGLVLMVAAEKEGRSHFANRKTGEQIVDAVGGNEFVVGVGMLELDIGH